MGCPGGRRRKRKLQKFVASCVSKARSPMLMHNLSKGIMVGFQKKQIVVFSCLGIKTSERRQRIENCLSRDFRSWTNCKRHGEPQKCPLALGPKCERQRVPSHLPRRPSCGTTVVRCAVYHGCHHLYIHTQSIRNQNCRLEFGRVEYCTIPQKRTGLEPSPSVKCLDRKCACLVLQLLLMSLTEEGQLVLVVLGLVGIRLPFFPNIPCNITLTGRIVDKRRHSK